MYAKSGGFLEAVFSRFAKWSQKVSKRTKRAMTFTYGPVLITALELFEGTYDEGADVWEMLIRCTVVVAIYYAITGLAWLEVERAEREAGEDYLTQLPNRNGMLKALKHRFDMYRRNAHGQKHQLLLATIVFDLDGFKKANDRLGHPDGDKVLVMVADIMRAVFHRPTDILGRMGGDEFVVVLTQTHMNHQHLMAILEELRRSIEETLQDPYQVTASIGACYRLICCNDNSPDWEKIDIVGEFESMLPLADAATYRAKRVGGNSVAVVKYES